MSDSVIKRMEELVRRAEKGETQFVETAREILALALIEGREVDETRLERLAIRVGENGLRGDPKALLLWSPLLTACGDYIRHKQVAMKDGRCATASGWDYSNCEPARLTAVVPRELVSRLEDLVGELTDAGPSNAPDSNPSEFDEFYNEIVSRALTAYLEGTTVSKEKARIARAEEELKADLERIRRHA